MNITKTELMQMIQEEYESVIKEMGEEGDVGETPEADSVREDTDLKNDLIFIAKAAIKAAKSIGSEQPEAWVESHILAAKELITSAADYFAEQGGDEDVTPHEDTENENPIEDPTDENVHSSLEEDINTDLKAKKIDYLKVKAEKDKKDLDDTTSGTATVDETQLNEYEVVPLEDEDGNQKTDSRGRPLWINDEGEVTTNAPSGGGDYRNDRFTGDKYPSRYYGDPKNTRRRRWEEGKVSLEEANQIRSMMAELKSKGEHVKIKSLIDKLQNYGVNKKKS